MGNPSLQDMTNKLNQLKANPAPDFRFDPTEAKKYTAQIQELIDALNGAQAKIGNLSHYGEVGSFASAQATKQNLTEDVDDLRQLLSSHVTYYEAFKGAVEAAGQSLQAADKP
jgi:hypothetical protein